MSNFGSIGATARALALGLGLTAAAAAPAGAQGAGPTVPIGQAKAALEASAQRYMAASNSTGAKLREVDSVLVGAVSITLPEPDRWPMGSPYDASIKIIACPGAGPINMTLPVVAILWMDSYEPLGVKDFGGIAATGGADVTSQALAQALQSPGGATLEGRLQTFQVPVPLQLKEGEARILAPVGNIYWLSQDGATVVAQIRPATGTATTPGLNIPVPVTFARDAAGAGPDWVTVSGAVTGVYKNGGGVDVYPWDANDPQLVARCAAQKAASNAVGLPGAAPPRAPATPGGGLRQALGLAPNAPLPKPLTHIPATPR
ncbi:hypothetical protein [Phenylobacterium sp.]|uniref:hypothetical protein n=1 Tax=Phenylobacterium sp. TaxID=1871053 RepID=UPI002C7B8E91|nr:hypothetical protein [Phenylobacterium sp.]HVI31854.1 hypothetical protein [Phenylobacterium sp.]